MAKVYLRLDRRTPSDDKGRYDVSIWFSNNTKTSSKRQGIKATEEEWALLEEEITNLPEAKMSTMARRLYKKLAAMRAEIEVLAHEKDIAKISAAELRDIICARVDGLPDPVLESESFLAYYEKFTSERKTEGNRKSYEYTQVSIKKFDTNARRLKLTDITPSWLYEFDSFLSKTLKQNSRAHHLRNIRAVINQAHKTGKITVNPFYAFKVSQGEQTRKRKLTIEELKTLRELACGKFEEEYRDLFFLCFYLIGINAVDLLTAKKTDIVDGRLEYRRAKTHRLYSIKIEPEAQKIIDKYAGKDWLISPLDRYKDYKDYLHHWNDGLKRIGTQCSIGLKRTGTPLFPELSTYWSRYTWATIAHKIDIPVDIIGRALGHAWTFSGITNIYIDFDNKKIDEANRKVLDSLL